MPNDEQTTVERCECQTRKALKAAQTMMARLYAQVLALRMAGRFGDTEWQKLFDAEVGEVATQTSAALLAHCPCEGMREAAKLELTDINRRLLAVIPQLEQLTAERDSLRDKLRHKSARLETLSGYASRIAAELASLQGERAVLLVEMQPADGTLIGVAAEMGRLRAQLAHYQRVANGATQVVGDLEAKLAASQEREKALREALEEIGTMPTPLMVRTVINLTLFNVYGNRKTPCNYCGKVHD